jgi:hypothetical protein
MNPMNPSRYSIVFLNAPCERHCLDHRLHVVHAGATVFVRERELPGGDGLPRWRLTKEGHDLLGSWLVQPAAK